MDEQLIGHYKILRKLRFFVPATNQEASATAA